MNTTGAAGRDLAVQLGLGAAMAIYSEMQLHEVTAAKAISENKSELLRKEERKRNLCTREMVPYL